MRLVRPACILPSSLAVVASLLSLNGSNRETITMTPWQQRVEGLTLRLAQDMKLRNLAQKTIDAYTYHVGRFARFLQQTTPRTLETATPEDVRSFQLHLIEDRKVGWSSFNQALDEGLLCVRATFPVPDHAAPRVARRDDPLRQAAQAAARSAQCPGS